MEYRIERNERGVLWASIDGVTLHSSRNPVREAEKIVEAEFTQAPPGVVVLGSGLLHHLQAIGVRYPDSKLILIEPDPGWPAQLSGLGLDPGSLCSRMYIAESQSQLPEDTVREAAGYFSDGYALFISAPYRKLFPVITGLLQGLEQRYRDRRMVNSNTLKRFGLRWVGNLLWNFLNTPDSPSITAFRDAFRSVPGLLLAGGPGLDELLPLLPELRRRMIVVAVDTAYYRIRAQGCEPDFVLSVDPQYWNSKHIERPTEIPPGQSPALVISESSAHPRGLRLLDNTTMFCRSLFPLGRFLEQKLEERAELGSGGSVATTAWDFLRYGGCENISIAGMDMGFPDNLTHFKGSYFEESMAFTGDRINPCEQQSFNYLNSGQPFLTENYLGGQVLSDRRMDIYCNWFENQLRKQPGMDVGNLSARARKIKGIGLRNIEELLQLPPVRSEIDAIIADRLLKARQAPPRTAPQTATVPRSQSQSQSWARALSDGQPAASLAPLRDSLENLTEKCRRSLQTISDCDMENAGEVQELLKTLDEIDKDILSDENRNIAGFLITHVMDSIAELPAPDNLRGALDRSQLLYSTLLQAADRHLELIRKAENRFKICRSYADTCSRE